MSGFQDAVRANVSIGGIVEVQVNAIRQDQLEHAEFFCRIEGDGLKGEASGLPFSVK